MDKDKSGKWIEILLNPDVLYVTCFIDAVVCLIRDIQKWKIGRMLCQLLGAVSSKSLLLWGHYRADL